MSLPASITVLSLIAGAYAQTTISMGAADDGFILAGSCTQSYCGSGGAIKAYQTVAPSSCYGCNRRIVMKWNRPAAFNSGSFQITNARLDLYKTWDGNAHGWGGNDYYLIRAVYSNWTDAHIVSAGVTPALAPGPVSGINNARVYIAPQVNRYVNLTITTLINDMYHNNAYGTGTISFDIAGEQRGCLSAFQGSASSNANPPVLTLTYRGGAPTSPPTNAPTTVAPTTMAPTAPTAAPTPNPAWTTLNDTILRVAQLEERTAIIPTMSTTVSTLQSTLTANMAVMSAQSALISSQSSTIAVMSSTQVNLDSEAGARTAARRFIAQSISQYTVSPGQTCTSCSPAVQVNPAGDMVVAAGSTGRVVLNTQCGAIDPCDVQATLQNLVGVVQNLTAV